MADEKVIDDCLNEAEKIFDDGTFDLLKIVTNAARLRNLKDKIAACQESLDKENGVLAIGFWLREYQANAVLRFKNINIDNTDIQLDVRSDYQKAIDAVEEKHASEVTVRILRAIGAPRRNP